VTAKHLTCATLALTSIVIGLSLSSVCWNGQSSAVAAPPLSLEGLLGDDEKLSNSTVKKDDLKADNFICLVCHGNFEEEELVVSHAIEDVGCADCHGASEAHADDEDHIIPPDKMFDRTDVDKMCATCHDMHDAPARKVIARWQERCQGKIDPSDIACTDCHYEHKMAKRTVWWNRKTRELVIRKDGQTTKPADGPAPATDM